MATRKKNSTFAGTSTYDVDIGAPTFTRTVEDAVGDTALVYDMVTGEHSESNTTDHTGSGRGALLGVPIANEIVNADLRFVRDGAGGASKDGAYNEVYLLAVPFYMPTGEGSVEVVLDGVNLDYYRPRLSIYSLDTGGATWSLDGASDSVPFIGIGGEFDELLGGQMQHSSRIDGLTPGGIKVCIVEADTAIADPGAAGALEFSDQVRLVSWHILLSPGRGARIRPQRSQRLEGVEVPITTPAAAEGVSHRNFWNTEFADNDALNGYVTAGLNRNQNGLMEYITGAPAGGNATWTHEDQDSGGVADSADPARSRFLAHTRALYASEPLIEFPFWCSALGGFGKDGYHLVDVTATAGYGMVGWRPFNATSAALTTVCAQILSNPDFPAADANNSNLKWCVIAGIGNGRTAGIGNWRCTAVNTTASDGPVAFQRIGTTYLAFASGGVSATAPPAAAAWGFAPDAAQTFSFQIDKATAFIDDDEIAILGVVVYYDP